MKIDNSVKSIGGRPSSANAARPAADKPAAPATPAAQVELSSLSSRLQQVEATLANVPVADASRVAELKQAISEGRFRVDAGKVADSLIHSVRQMLAAQTNRA